MPATEEGNELLVGREEEIKKLEVRVAECGNHVTIEGDNGVGKTSLLSVVAYRLRSSSEAGESPQLFLPLCEVFQLNPEDSVDEFVKKVYYQIASTIDKEYPVLRRYAHRVPDIADVRSWLRAPLLHSTGTNVSALGFGAGGSRGRSVNSSAGFADSGFKATIDEWLPQLFPTNQSGGFVGVIDNLELLETTQNARRLLEGLRDPLLNRRGLRWILCGARGIVRTAVSSQRLEGRLAEPLEIRPISDGYVSAAIERRIERYRVDENAVAPLGPESFQYLYDVLNCNLRNAFKYARDFSFWLLEEGTLSGDASEYDGYFRAWLAEQADRHNEQTDLTKRAWQVFDDLASGRGWCSPGDFEEFGFNSMPRMRTHIKALEQENLVFTSLNDESDKRRKTICMTPRGWLVRYSRSGYELP
ncbi:hypothetical protein [Amycolatopsis nigrescens]|uniref:hypothetical protein n=1 Tax=Amycolatopsis nigrescens TaxID=381445 RepID=UPI0012FC04F0|nr:hypothetical protein [Amycolatopsis nigrescens]